MGPVARIAEQQARLLGPTKAITDQFKAQTWALNDRGLSREFEEQMERVRAAKEREHRAQLETAAAVKELAASSRAQVRTQWATAIVSAILGALVGSIISWAAGRSDVARGQSGPGGVPSASRDADVAAQRCIPSHVGRP